MLKDGSLQSNSLAFNNCFSFRNIYQNGVKALSKIAFKNPVFCQKAQILYISDRTIMFKFYQHVVQTHIK